MKLLESRKLNLPKVYFISERDEIKDIPIGVPFIYGDDSNEGNIIRILEYEVLYQMACRTGLPFNFKNILRENGYKDLLDFSFGDSVYMEYSSDKFSGDIEIEDLHTLRENADLLSKYIRDSAVYVDIQKLKNLNIFPIWFDKIVDAVSTNIHNFATFNENMYNKKLDGMYGGIEFTSPNKNLIIIDISGSIPRGVSATCLTLSKNLAENFYADILITGSKSTLYLYEELYKLNVETVYSENEMDNDQIYFKNLITKEEKHYKTAIVFGDNDSPCRAWRNDFNKGSRTISKKEGQEFNKWKIDHLISFHTGGTKHIAAYADWFTPDTEERINNWVKYLNN